jgi:hypothetical protein
MTSRLVVGYGSSSGVALGRANAMLLVVVIVPEEEWK